MSRLVFVLALLPLLGCSDQSIHPVLRDAPAEVEQPRDEPVPFDGAFGSALPGDLPEGDDDDAPIDLDGDGFSVDDDCDDDDPAVHPGAVEQCRSRKDEDCAPSTNCDDTCLPEFDYGLCDDVVVTAPAPVLHWSYDDVDGGTLHGDVGLDGALTGAPTFGPGLRGDAATFDGASWIFAGAPLALPGDVFTMATWVRLEAAENPGPYDFLMSNGNGDPAFTGASMFVGGGTPSSLLEGGQGALETMHAGPRICDSGWAHVVVRFDHGTSITSVDGAGEAQAAPFTEIVWGGRTFGVGQDPNNLTRGFTGSLDETKVWAEAVSDADLQGLRDDAICAR